jgi:anaerobic magnesium-protoporphyrin IX monomethyl ester cyclase
MTELATLCKRGVREVHLEDENFTLSKQYVLEFCDALERSGLGLSWSLPSGVRIDTLDADLLDRMERAGCYSLALGIEFGTDRVMQLAKKGLTVGKIRKKMGLFRGRRIKTTGFFLFGVPGEKYEEMQKTLEFALELPLDRAQFNNFMPLPGSGIWTELALADRLGRLDWDRMFVHDVAYCDEGIMPHQIKSLQRKAYLRFYLRPRILFSLVREIRSFHHLKFLLKRLIDAIV